MLSVEKKLDLCQDELVYGTQALIGASEMSTAKKYDWWNKKVD